MIAQVRMPALSPKEILYLQTAIGDFTAESKRFPGAFNEIILNSFSLPKGVTLPPDALSRLTRKDNVQVHRDIISPLMGLLSLLEFHLEPYRKDGKIQAQEMASLITLCDVTATTFSELLPRGYPERARARLNLLAALRRISQDSSPEIRETLTQVEVLCMDDIFRSRLFGARRPEDALAGLPEKLKIQFLYLETLRRHASVTPARSAFLFSLSPESLARLQGEPAPLEDPRLPQTSSPRRSPGQDTRPLGLGHGSEVLTLPPAHEAISLSVFLDGALAVPIALKPDDEPLPVILLGGNRSDFDSF